MADVTSQLRRRTIRWDIALPEAFADRSNPTVAELNNADLVFNITCAVDEEGTTFSLGDSETDDRYSYCDDSGVDRPTFYNPEATLAIYRDADRAAAGQFNLAFDLLGHEDVKLFIIKRVGDSDNNAATAYALGDRIKMQYGSTDYIADILASEDPVMFEQTPLQLGFTNWNYEVAA